MVKSEYTYKQDPTILAMLRVKRSWRDRLFTWPWRPWVAYEPRTFKYVLDKDGEFNPVSHDDIVREPNE